MSVLLRTVFPILSLSDVNVAFQQAAHKILFDDDVSLSRFRMTIAGKVKAPAKSESLYHLGSLSLKFTIVNNI